jgi:hypothetical protein
VTNIFKRASGMISRKPGDTVDSAATGPRGRVAALIAFDVAMLVELSVAMYRANAHSSDFTNVFLKTFFGLLIPTLLLWRYGSRKLSRQNEGRSVARGEGT